MLTCSIWEMINKTYITLIYLIMTDTVCIQFIYFLCPVKNYYLELLSVGELSLTGLILSYCHMQNGMTSIRYTISSCLCNCLHVCMLRQRINNCQTRGELGEVES